MPCEGGRASAASCRWGFFQCSVQQSRRYKPHCTFIFFWTTISKSHKSFRQRYLRRARTRYSRFSKKASRSEVEAAFLMRLHKHSATPISLEHPKDDSIPLRNTATTMIALATLQSEDPDAQLMARVRDGEDEAFNELMKRYEDRVHRLVFKLMGRSQDVEDLTQQIFLRAYRARAGYQPSASFASWIFTISRNVVCNAKRSVGRRREWSAFAVDAGTFNLGGPFGNDSQFDALHRQEAREEVRAAINQLNDRQREAICLTYLQGCSYFDAANRMGMSVTAIKSLVCRAKGKLRAMLKSRVT